MGARQHTSYFRCSYLFYKAHLQVVLASGSQRYRGDQCRLYRRTPLQVEPVSCDLQADPWVGIAPSSPVATKSPQGSGLQTRAVGAEPRQPRHPRALNGRPARGSVQKSGGTSIPGLSFEIYHPENDRTCCGEAAPRRKLFVLLRYFKRLSLFWSRPCRYRSAVKVL